MEDQKRIVEINGIKMEVDMRTAKRVDQFRVGDPVKVLVKQYNEYRAMPGVIVGFTEFKTRPAIDVLYIEGQYGTNTMKFVSITEDTTEVEIAPFYRYEGVLEYNQVVESLNRNVQEKESALLDAKAKRDLFLKHFGEAFGSVAEGVWTPSVEQS